MILRKFFNVTYNTSRPVLFCKKTVLKSFTKLTAWKHLYRKHFFFDEIASCMPAILFKRDYSKDTFLKILRSYSKQLFYRTSVNIKY